MTAHTESTYSVDMLDQRGLFPHHKGGGHDDDGDKTTKDTAGPESTTKEAESASTSDAPPATTTRPSATASSDEDSITTADPSKTLKTEDDLSKASSPTPTFTAKDGSDDDGESGVGKLTGIIKGTKLTGLLPHESTSVPTTLSTSTIADIPRSSSHVSVTTMTEPVVSCSGGVAYPLPGVTASPEPSSHLCKTIDHQASTITAMTGTIVALAVVLVLGPLVAWGFWKKLRRPRSKNVIQHRQSTLSNSLLGGFSLRKASKEQQAQNRISALVEMEMPEVKPRRPPPPPPPPPRRMPLPPEPVAIRPSSTAAAIAAQIKRGGRPASSVYSQETNGVRPWRR